MPLCTPTKRLTVGDRHVLFESCYPELSARISDFAAQGYSQNEIFAAIVAGSRYTSLMCHSITCEIDYHIKRVATT